MRDAAMRIALVHTNLTRGGGMEAYLLSLVKGFRRQGDSVTVYACRVDWDLARELGCTVHQIRPLLPRKMREFRFLHRCSELSLRRDYDLAIGTARTSSQHVTVCCGVHAETIRHIRRTALLRAVYDVFEKRCEKNSFCQAPHIMAHSDTIARQIVAHYQVDPAKIKVLYPPIDIDTFRPMDSQARVRARAALGIADHRLTLLFVSCGHQRKGLDQLCKAFAELDPDRYELLVAGSAITGPHPVNVRYIGYVNDLRPVYGAVDCTVLPSYYEPFGLVVPESLQCGTPVMVTRNVGATELLTGHEAVLLDNNNPATLVEAIRQLERGVRIEPGFAERHGLTIDQHIQSIKAAFC